MLKYGVNLPNFGAFGDPRLVADLAREAEAAGWDGFFIWDHINRSVKLPVIDPWITLAAVAMTTQKMTLGALVTPIARRRPWKLAREAATLDHLSGGRLILGVGLGSSGGRDVEWADFGEESDLKTRAAMLDEGLAILAGLWSGETFSYDGQHYQVKPTQFLPKPLQTPRIPIWVGGSWPNRAPFKRAARWDGVFPLLDDQTTPKPDQLRALVEYVREQHGDDRPFEVICLAEPTAGDDLAQAAAIVAPYQAAGATWWLEELKPQRFGVDWSEEWPFEALRERILQGPPKG